MPTVWLLICTLTCRLAEAVRRRSQGQLPDPRGQVQRRHRPGQGTGAGQVDGADAPHRLQRLPGRQPVRAFHVRWWCCRSCSTVSRPP
ncbi:hypothetical protein ACU4GD_07435 [Cupriavidus basilensis]